MSETTGQTVMPKQGAPVSTLKRKARRYLTHEGLAEQIAETDRKRESGKEWFNDPNLTDVQIIESMRENVAQAGNAFMEGIRNADLYARGISLKKKGKALDGMNKAYANMMVISCLGPLRAGISPESVLSTVGMGTAMWLMSKNFRKEMGEHAFSIRNSVQKKFDARANDGLDKALGRMENNQNKSFVIGGKKLRNAIDQRYVNKWLGRYEKAQKRQRGGMEPFTAHSAAMTTVALMENAYAMMRTEGADVDAIMEEHRVLQNHVYLQAFEDGIDAKDIDSMVRVVCNSRVKDNEVLNAVFKETAHGEFIPVNGILNDKGQSLFVSSTQGWATEGSLSLRPPMSDSDHWNEIKSTFFNQLTKTKSEKDALQLMSAYSLAHGTFFHDDMKMSMDNSPVQPFARLGRSMVQSMIDDGISENDSQHIYVNALMAAIDEYAGVNKTFMAEWTPAKKAEFVEFMSNAANDPYAAFTAYQDTFKPAESESPRYDGDVDASATISDDSVPVHKEPPYNYQRSRRNQQQNASDSEKAESMMENESQNENPDFRSLQNKIRQMGLNEYEGPDVDFEMG